MKKEEMETLTKGIQKKLGKEQSALINDDLATILLDNTSMNTELETRQTTIQNLQKDKEDLIMTNNRLFQQVAVGEETTPTNEKKEEKKEPFSFKSVFDEKGNFIN